MGFTKHYRTADAMRRAQAHHSWLDRLGLPVPALIACRPRSLELSHIPGRHVAPNDVPASARLLGAAHTAAYRACLHRARLGAPFHLPGIGALEAFTTSRIDRVRQHLEQGSVPAPAFTAKEAAQVLSSAADEPAAFYKDANLRNFLVTQTGIVVIDFDDLTLAPFGYDLAKLILTTAMTYGPLPPRLTTTALDAYNQATEIPCTPDRLRDWLEIHHILTSPYLGRNGYTHSWHTLRPTETRPR
ncbi:phosphotransferase [Streptomyces sp. B15]|uniref:phosphotransferase n=1 Tax=Streptomyces sp. B15 TaxID=1537797 RepID=UPI001B39A36F|nr:phosphotransferase [Streptomyces sp. B15]